MLNLLKMNCFYFLFVAQTSIAATSTLGKRTPTPAPMPAPAPAPIPIQYYRAQIPQTNQSCEAEAQAMAARFSAATKVAATRGNCVEVYQTNTTQGKRTVYSIEVSYPREWAFNPNSTVYGVGYLSWDITGKYSGLYLDYDSCVAELSMRTAEYYQHTGLIPVAASCERSATLTRTDYILQIDGFGNPKQNLYVFAPDLILFPSDAVFMSDIKNMLPKAGAQLVAEEGFRLFYYSEKAINLRGTTVAYFDNPDHCRAQIQEAQKIFTSKDALPASVHCVVTPDTQPETALAVIYTSFDTPFSFEGTEHYPSFEECLLDHDRALARAARSHSWVAGGICRKDIIRDDSYELVIFQNRAAF